MKRLGVFLIFCPVVLWGCHDVASTAGSEPVKVADNATLAKPSGASTAPITSPSAMVPPVASVPTPAPKDLIKPGTKIPPAMAANQEKVKAMEQKAAEIRAIGLKAMAIPSPKEGEWGPSTLGAAELAAKVGESVHSLKNTYGDMMTVLDTPKGNGHFNEEIKISDNKKFRIDYLAQQEPPRGSSLVANGKLKMDRVGSKWTPPIPVSKPFPNTPRSADTMMKQWPTAFTRMIFQGLTDGVDVWKPVVTQLEKSGDYKVWVEERTIQRNGHDYHNFRIRADRQGPAAKKLGDSSMEVVVDAHYMLPTTVRLVSTDPAGKKTETMWVGRYKFNQKFTDKDFVAPYNMKSG